MALNSREIVVNPLMNLTCVINPENEKSFEYLTKFFNYLSVEKIATKYSVEELMKKEKIVQDMIRHPSQHNTNRLSAWCEYVNWIVKLFGKKDLRYFLVLENFTKSTAGEKEFYLSQEFGRNWMTYIELCADAVEVVKYMKRYEITTKTSSFYLFTALLYEKEHDFLTANNLFIEGFDRKVADPEKLQEFYKNFESRMEGRINREVKTSVISSEDINSHIQSELKKKNEALNKETFNTNNKRLRNSPDDTNFSNFLIKKKKFEYLDNTTKATNTAISTNEGINSLQYQNFPIFVDEPFRKNVISKGTKLVEIYSILMKFLIEKDPQFKIQNDEFSKNLKLQKSKMPFSWLNGMRIIPDKSLPTENLMNLHITNNDCNVSSNNVVVNESAKVDDVMNKMINVMKRKKEESEQADIKIEKEKKVDNMNNNPNNNITYNNNSTNNLVSNNINSIINNPVNTNAIQNHIHINTDTILANDGRKYRIVKVETNKKETEIVIDISKMRDEVTKQNQTLEQKRAKFYFQQQEIKKKQLAALHNVNKRKTIIYKIDSDGDYCMDSDEEESAQESQEVLIMQPRMNFAGKSNTIIQENKPTKQEQKGQQHINHNQPSFNLNLFNHTMSDEEINEKIKEVTNLYQTGKINIETRDILYNHLEEKIIQMEKMENEKKNKLKQASVQSLSQINNNNINNCRINNNIVNNNTNTNPNSNPFLNPLINKIKVKESSFMSYLEPDVDSKKSVPSVNLNFPNKPANPIQTISHNQPLVELPVTNYRKAVEETPFSNVSRSLDFTNIKLIESNNKNLRENIAKPPVPLSSIFMIDNQLPSAITNKNLYFKNEISFDSEHSHMFQQPLSSSTMKEGNNFLDEISPAKRDSTDLIRAFNVKDTPQLIKKSYKIYEDSNSFKKINQVNNNQDNNNVIHNNQVNNNVPVNRNNNITKKYTDFNNILNSKKDNLDSDNESDEERKIKMSKLFGDAFGNFKKEEFGQIPFGLSSITEKTGELSDDSFIFKKLI